MRARHLQGGTRPGADGATGVAAFVNAQDDHTLLFSISGPITTLPVVQDKSPYDPARDLVPIGSVADSFISIATSSSTKIRSLADVGTTAKAQPGKLNFNAGAGALPYLFAGFMKNAGIDMVLVPYRETNAAVTDLAEGRLQIIVSAMAALRAQVDAGKIRQLAVTNKMRPRRRSIQLAELLSASWVLPPPESVIGSVAAETFRAGGLDYPRVTVVTVPREVRMSLVATGRFLTILPKSALRFSSGGPEVKVLPVKLPFSRGPIGIVTLKNRTLSPVAKLFIEHAREVAKRLTKMR